MLSVQTFRLLVPKERNGLFVYDLTFGVFLTICLALQNTAFLVGTVACDPLERLHHRSNVEKTSKSSTSLIACRIDEGVSLGSRNFPDVAALPMSPALFSRYWKLKRKWMNENWKGYQWMKVEKEMNEWKLKRISIDGSWKGNEWMKTPHSLLRFSALHNYTFLCTKARLQTW